MTRALAMGSWALAALVVAGCGGSAPCKSGTVLLTVHLPTIPPAGAVASLTILGGGLEIQGTATLDALLKGPLELDLPSYPQGQTIEISVSIDDLAGVVDVALVGSCATATLTLAPSIVDLSTSPVDFAGTVGDQGALVDIASPPRDQAQAPRDQAPPLDMSLAPDLQL